MTHEEMAQVLTQRAANARRWMSYYPPGERMAEEWRAIAEASEAGAAALRAMEWKKVPDDPAEIPDCPVGTHRVCGRWLNGEWMTETEMSPTFIDYSKPTHYFELPAPPEGV